MNKVITIYTETPLHVRASERSEERFARLPLQGDIPLPTVPGTTVAGGIRRGVVAKEGGTRSFELSGFGAAQVLFYPLRALNRPLLWATSVELLEHFFQECSLARDAVPPADSLVTVSSAKAMIEGRVFVESVSFPCAPSDALKRCADAVAATVLPQGEEYQFIRDTFSESVVVLPHETLSLLVQTSTEVTAQLPVRSEEGPITSAGFFFRECLPSETVLYSVVQPEGHPLLEAALETGLTRVQLGADETRGRGICAIRAQTGTQEATPTGETSGGSGNEQSDGQNSQEQNSQEHSEGAA